MGQEGSDHIEEFPVGEIRVMRDSEGNPMLNDLGEPRREFKYIRINGDVGWYESLAERPKLKIR